MRRTGLIIAVIAILFSIMITLTGCDEKSNDKDKVKSAVQEKQEQKETKKEPEKIVLKDGTYEYVSEGEEDQLMEGEVFIQISNGTITLVDGFAGLSLEGTYKLEGNRLLGTYTSMIYINHALGGEYTTEDISDELEFVIQKDGTLVDFKGYGASLGNIMMVDAQYKLNENPET